ncbi:MAG: hypothetical protein LUG50_03720, partial [Planctomycetaceae bacterium]|nr:hypothetical protein [Planctomycetaceae bacterium]
LRLVGALRGFRVCHDVFLKAEAVAEFFAMLPRQSPPVAVTGVFSVVPENNAAIRVRWWSSRKFPQYSGTKISPV